MRLVVQVDSLEGGKLKAQQIRVTMSIVMNGSAICSVSGSRRDPAGIAAVASILSFGGGRSTAKPLNAPT